MEIDQLKQTVKNLYEAYQSALTELEDAKKASSSYLATLPIPTYSAGPAAWALLTEQMAPYRERCKNAETRYKAASQPWLTAYKHLCERLHAEQRGNYAVA